MLLFGGSERTVRRSLHKFLSHRTLIFFVTEINMILSKSSVCNQLAYTSWTTCPIQTRTWGRAPQVHSRRLLYSTSIANLLKRHQIAKTSSPEHFNTLACQQLVCLSWPRNGFELSSYSVSWGQA